MRRTTFLLGVFGLLVACDAGNEAETTTAAAKPALEPVAASEAVADAAGHDQADGPAPVKEVEPAPPVAQVEPTTPPTADTKPVVEAAAAAGEAAFVWERPACALTYHYVGGGGDLNGQSSLDLEFDMTMAPQERWVSMHAGEMKLSHTLQGKPWGEPQKVAEGRYADIHLEARGGSWREVDGVTKLWSAFDQVLPVAMAWPALPSSLSVGATATWTMAAGHGNPALIETEAARGSEALPDGWVAPPFEAPPGDQATVTIESIGVDGAPVVLVVEANQSKDDMGMKLAGRYEVTPAGRLNKAEVTIDLSMKDKVMAVMRLDFTLTRGCPGE